MLEARAVVVELEGADAIVEARQGSGCGHCDSAKGCGTGKLSQLFCTSPRRFRVRNSINAHVGEEVQVSLAEGVLLRSALIMYFLPLLLALGGGLLGTHWAADNVSGDLYSAMGAGLGLAGGLMLIRLSALRHRSAAPPVISRCG